VDDAFILFVDDKPQNADLFTIILRSHGFSNVVVPVGDGIEALDFLFCRGDYAGRDVGVVPRLIVLDLNMPRMDGLETLRQLRDDKRTKLLPVVILTLSDHPRDKTEAYRLGANGYVDQVSDVPFPEAVRRIASYWLEVNQVAPPEP
jgi:two-component system, response regulator